MAHFQQADTEAGGDLRHLVQRGAADLAGRLVDDAAQAQVVGGVGNDGHIGKDVLDFLAVIEPLAAHDLVWDARPGEVCLDGAGLGVHAVEHSVIPQAGALFQMAADDGSDVAGLVLLILSGVAVDLVALAVVCPEGLALAALVVFYNAVGRVQDVGGGTVVLFQPDDLCAGEMLLEVQDVLDGGAPETVDALVIVAHHTDVLFRPGEQAHQMELGHTGVLILVYKDILVLLLIVFPHVCILLQKADGMINQVVEIHRAGAFQPSGIGGVHLGQQHRLGVAGGRFQRFFGADELVLHAADLAQSASHWQEFVVHKQLLVDFLHCPFLVAGVIDGKAFGKAQFISVAPEHPHTGRVEGGGVHVRALRLPQHGGKAGFQFPCRLVGEGDGQHVPGAGVLQTQHRPKRRRDILPCKGGFQAFQVLFRCRPGQPFGVMRLAEADDVGDAVHQHRGLAAARAGQDEQRALGAEHRFFLRLVQPFKPALDKFIPKGRKSPVKFL